MATGKQIAALKYVLFKSPELGNLFKRVVATLLDESKSLTRPVVIRLETNMQGFERKQLKQLYRDCSVATSCGGKTHINELIAMIGSDLSFSHSEGNTDCQVGFWARKGKKKPKIVEVTNSKLQKIDLARPGLYPSLEKDEALRRTG